MNEPKFRSIARWPKDQGINLGSIDNESDDTHATREEAEAVATMLQQRGFGGDGRIFPIETRIEEIATKTTPAAGMTPEQMRIALAREHGYVEQPDRFYIDRRAWMKNRIKHATIDLPPYPEDANAALEIVEMMRERGWNATLENGMDGTWEALFHKPLTDDTPRQHRGVIQAEEREIHYGPADTLQLAICTAALKALGHLQ